MNSVSIFRGDCPVLTPPRAWSIFFMTDGTDSLQTVKPKAWECPANALEFIGK